MATRIVAGSAESWPGFNTPFVNAPVQPVHGDTE
jgi:hypothetical protein